MTEKAYKNTKQRQQILNVIRSSEGHLTAEQVFTRLRDQDELIGIATVYRNLNLLYQNHLINRVQHPDYGFVYDKNVDDHYHLRCVRCNRLFDVEMEHQDDLDRQAEQLTGAKISGHKMVFEGICADCLKNETEQKH